MQTLNNKRKMASVSNLKNKIKCLFISNKRRRELRVMANKFHQTMYTVKNRKSIKKKISKTIPADSNSLDQKSCSRKSAKFFSSQAWMG